MKNTECKFINIFILLLNFIGFLCLLYFAIPFLNHDMTITNSNQMLTAYSWDSCGFILCLGLLPLIIANTLAYIFFDVKNKVFKLLFFIPSLICLILVSCYLFISFNTDKPEHKSEFISGMKCSINNKIYKYAVYKEKDGTYSVSMDEKDNIPQSVIVYDTPEDIFSSIEKYYKDNNGMCP